MIKKIRTFEVLDLFCGAGGTSTGIIQAAEELGIKINLTAVNHWKTAVNSHTLNHPNVRHLCQDVETLFPREVVPSGHLDLLSASCECTFHSNARGGGPCNEQSRSQVWQLIRWVNDIRVDNILLENVPEFQHYGPLLHAGIRYKGKYYKKNCPDPRRKGEAFRAFLEALKNSGYHVEWKIQNAADFGDPTKRRRLILMARLNKPVVWPAITHGTPADCHKQQRHGQLVPYLTARDHVIDWNLEGKSIFNRKKPLSQNTIRRIMAGFSKFGGVAAEPFLVMLRGLSESHINASVTSVDEPIRTVTASGTHIALAEPFLIGQQSGAVPSSVDSPIPTIATAGAISLTKAVVKPFIVPQFSTANPKSVDDPIGAITTDGGPALVEPFLMQANHGKDPKARGKESRRVKSLDQPIPTVTTSSGLAIVEPFIIPKQSKDKPQSVDKPLPTVTTKVGPALVKAFIVPSNYGERKGQKPRIHSADEPLPTVVGSGTHGVVEPIIVHSTHAGKRPAHSTKAPLPTVTGAHRGEMALVEPVIVQTDQTGSNGHCTQPVTEPLKTVVSKQNMGLVEPFILPKEGFYRGNTPKSVDEPMVTITASERATLVQPFVVKYYGTGGAKDLNQPLDTVTTKDRFLLVQPQTGEILAELDIRFRMLQPHELAAAHSFPKSYVFTGNKGEQTKQIGNSVPVRMSRKHAYVALLGNLAAIGPHRIPARFRKLFEQ